MHSFNSVRAAVVLAAASYGFACSNVEGESEAASDVASTEEGLRCPSSEGHVVDLGVLDADPQFGSAARAINQRGTIVGSSNARYSPALNPTRAFRWTARSGMVDLGTLGGPSSFASDVNDREQVAGAADLADGSMHACVWDAAGRVRDLGTLGGSSSSAYGINNRGQVIGLADDSAGSTRPFFWDPTTGMTDLGLGGTGLAYLNGINDSGVVVGAWLQADFSAVPFKWTREDGPTVLNLLGGSNGEASGVNNRGDIVGYVVKDGVVVGMKWTAHGAATPVATIPDAGVQTWPLKLNNRGTMVGNDNLSSGDFVALVWESPGRVQRLPLDTRYAAAYDINDRGQIVGAWSGPHGSHAFLWEPGR